MILIDTRQQPGKHDLIEAYLDKRGIPYDRCKLYVGDYAIANCQRRVVDTKSGVLELMMDVQSDHHETFSRELQRAKDAGIDLLVLVEEALPPGGLSAWVSPTNRQGKPLSSANPETLRRALLTLTAKYGARFRFVDRKDAARVLVEYLTEGVLP